MEKEYYFEEYEDVDCMIECINNLINCAENSVGERSFEHTYVNENGSCRIIKELFDEEQYLDFYTNGFDTYIALLNNMVLKITNCLPTSYAYPTHIISLSKNADDYFVVRNSYGSSVVSVIDNEGNHEISSLPCLNHYNFSKKYKIPLNQVIKSTSIEQMKDRINKLRNRDQLREQISSLSEEEILNVSELINANLKNHQERQKVISRKK